MDLEGIISFLAVVREQSITRAAESLHLTQPSLSARIKKLEEALGVTLFERQWNGVKLTNQGNYFLSYALQTIQDINNASIAMKRAMGTSLTPPFIDITSNKRLHIGIESWITSLVTEPLMKVLQDQFSDFEFKILTRPSKTIIELLDSGAIQIGIFYKEEPTPHLETIHLMDDEMMFVCSKKDFIRINGDLKNMSLLLDKPFVLFDNPVLVNSSSITRQIFMKLGFPQRYHIVEDVHVMGNIIAHNQGFSIVPKSSIVPLTSYPISFIAMGEYMPYTSIALAFSKFDTFSLSMKQFSDAIQSHIAKVYGLINRLPEVKKTV